MDNLINKPSVSLKLVFEKIITTTIHVCYLISDYSSSLLNSSLNSSLICSMFCGIGTDLKATGTAALISVIKVIGKNLRRASLVLSMLTYSRTTWVALFCDLVNRIATANNSSRYFIWNKYKYTCIVYISSICFLIKFNTMKSFNISWHVIEMLVSINFFMYGSFEWCFQLINFLSAEWTSVHLGDLDYASPM